MTLQLKFILFYFIFKNCNVTERRDFNRIECHSSLLSLWNHSLFSMQSRIEFWVPVCNRNIDVEGILDLMFHCYLPLMTLQLKTIIPETKSVIECASIPADPNERAIERKNVSVSYLFVYLSLGCRDIFINKKSQPIVNVWLGHRHIARHIIHNNIHIRMNQIITK